MTLLQSIILGIIQGATEFLPISSSGHLVLIPSLLGWELPPDEAFALNVILQAATLVAVFSYFFADILAIIKSTLQALRTRSWDDPTARLALLIILATIPAGLAGLLLSDLFERAFNDPLATAFFLIGTAVLLVIAEYFGKRDRSLETIDWKDALWVGFFQILALFPGISRSGTTITAGMLRDFDRPTSARFSFLISIPLMLGAGAKGFYDFISLPDTGAYLTQFLVASLTAALVGYLSIKWLLKFLNHRSLYVFAGYCTLFSLLNIILLTV
jgi:undecaprenyl-diphosphatase